MPRSTKPPGLGDRAGTKETFGIRGGKSVEVDLKFTAHGPVLWEDGKRALALRWVGAEPGTAGYLGSLAVDRAQNWKEFEAAMPRWKVPSENIVFADRAGNIGEHSTGLAPLRKTWTGLLPVPGRGGYEWSGFVPNSKLPHDHNPRQGFIATANHKMIPDRYPYKVGYSWAPPYRFQRVTEVLQRAQAGNKLDVGDMQRLQTDVLSLPALQLIDLLRAAVAQEKANPAAELLLHWNCEVERDSPAAALYEVWLQIVTRKTMDMAISPAARTMIDDWSPHQVIALSRGQQSSGNRYAGRNPGPYAPRIPGRSLEGNASAPGSGFDEVVLGTNASRPVSSSARSNAGRGCSHGSIARFPAPEMSTQ